MVNDIIKTTIINAQNRWEELYNNYPAKRPATVKEVADLCAFLASPLAGYITGIIVTLMGEFLQEGLLFENNVIAVHVIF